MTPKEIISKHIIGIEGIRIPFARIIVENIMIDLAEHGYCFGESTITDQKITFKPCSPQASPKSKE